MDKNAIVKRIRMRQNQAVEEMDRICNMVGLPTYTLLFSSIEQATQKLLPSCQVITTPHSTELARRSSETFAEWAIRYADAYLATDGDVSACANDSYREGR
jgi:hypothetical protein